MYYDGFLVVASNNSFKYVHVLSTEVANDNMNVGQYAEDNLAPMIEKESIGLTT